ncbi:CRISPR-associated helicase/endonuclease Cas3 [Haloechinothrix salitolerans]
MLSEAARSVWAKSTDQHGGWLPLWKHMDDAADVASALFDRWLPPSVVRLFAKEFDGDTVQARAAIAFLAGVHDLGKATPAFAIQDVLLAQRMAQHNLRIPSTTFVLHARSVAHHSVAGHHLLMRWLMAKGFPQPIARTWGVVLGGHHGVLPDSEAENAANPRHVRKLYGDGVWETVQVELAERMADRVGATRWLGRWRDVKLSAQFQVLATAVVIVSDWIASNDELLPFYREELPQVADSSERVRQALDKLRLPAPWQPTPPGGGVAELFAARFDLPDGARPYPVQEAVCEVARSMPEPGLLIVEAPMGEGKTEAALAAAEIAAGRWGFGGLFVALPTQATSDAMFHRVIRWLDAMGSDDQQIGGAVTLSHCKARFNRLFQGLMRAGWLRDIGRDEHEGRHAVVPHSWMSGRNKAQLANFTVSTFDQLLFTALKSRHVMLRHLGLAGKVVVLDEIHAYDAFMNSYLTKVLTWLGAYQVPVVALSATLPSDRRRALVEAYQRGREKTCGDLSQLDGDIGYPALIWTEGSSARTRVAKASSRCTSVGVDFLDDDLDTLISVLRDALSDGGTALVVRNTVRRVLEAATRLEREFPGEVTLAHSRFITADRMRKDNELLDMFGSPQRALRRPYRHVVVASQVVEQSLDIDFDILVTDLAPIDLVLQRMGRLHRHERGVGQIERPPKVRSARAFITGVDFEQHPPRLEQATERYVYGTHFLLRSAAVLWERFGKTIELPGDVAPLVQQAYGPDDIGPVEWREAMAAARQTWNERTAAREERATQFQIDAPTKPGKAIIGWLSAHAGEADEDTAKGQGQVRDGAPSLEVLLVYEDASGQWHTPMWLDGGRGGLPIPREDVPSDDLAEAMAACALRLPLTLSNPDAEEELKHATPPAWKASRLIRRLPVLVVDGDGNGQINNRRLRYTVERGLEVFDSDE